ncbi:MAG: hypothetical protein E3K29_03960 [Candidatus Brocadia sp.]|nr:hypothetical protein [Candidatus Brocadia sp.]
MAKQTSQIAIPEVETYRELRKQITLEQKKLTEAEEELTRLNARLEELEGENSKAELKKKAALERHAANEISLKELKSEVRTQFLDTTQEQENTREFIDVVESVIKKQTDTVMQLRQQMKEIASTIWGRIADIYQKKLETAIGDTANYLWVAMRNARYINSTLPGDLPERLKMLATPDQQESESIRQKLWSEFVEAE